MLFLPWIFLSSITDRTKMKCHSCIHLRLFLFFSPVCSSIHSFISSVGSFFSSRQVDHLLIGGAMAFTFLKARGITVGDSLVEEEFLGEAEQLLKVGILPTVRARTDPVLVSFFPFPSHFSCLGCTQRAGEKILLPKDVLLAERFAEDAPFSVLRIEEEDAGAAGALKGMALDIGPETVQEFTNYIQRSVSAVTGSIIRDDIRFTIFWDGEKKKVLFPFIVLSPLSLFSCRLGLPRRGLWSGTVPWESTNGRASRPGQRGSRRHSRMHPSDQGIRREL